MMFEENVAKVKRGTVDRISELPDFVLHNILLILDTQEAGRASVLSKRWYVAWSSIPVLFFHPLYFKLDEDIGDNDESEESRLERYVEFIDNTMRRYFMHEYRIKKMYLEITIDDEKLETLVDKWIIIAVLRQIEELEIEVHGEIEYMPPEFLFCAKSLNVLNCRNIALPYYEMMELVSLTHLTLEPMSVDENMLQRIISFCPLVELEITHEYLDDVSLPWTRKVDGGVEGCGSGIVQSNLQTHPLQKFVYNLGVHLPWPWSMNVVALKNLRKLEFSCASITDDVVSELAYGLIALESLALHSCSRLKYVKISSISLKELCVRDYPDFLKVESQDFDSQELMKVTVDAPNLIEFSYNCKLETSLSLIRVLDQCNAKFYPMMTDYLTTEWFVELKMFLMETKLFKSLKMDLCNSNQIEVEHDQLMNAGTGQPCKLRLLTLCGISDDSTPTESSLVAFLDALFWCCHPDVLSIRTNVQNLAAKLILSILKGKVQCWKDPLKSIAVECIESPQLLSYLPQLEIRLRLSW